MLSCLCTLPAADCLLESLVVCKIVILADETLCISGRYRQKDPQFELTFFDTQRLFTEFEKCGSPKDFVF